MEINLILNAGISAVLSAMLALTGYSGKTASNSGGTSEARVSRDYRKRR